MVSVQSAKHKGVVRRLIKRQAKRSAPENAYESVIVLIVYESCLLENHRLLPGDFSTRQTRDSTAQSGIRFLLPLRLCGALNFLISLVPSGAILWIFAASPWTKCPDLSAGAPVLPERLVLPEQFERFVRRSLSPWSDRFVDM